MRSFSLLLALPLVACGGPVRLYGDNGSPSQQAANADMAVAPSPDLAPPPYPPGPYGNQMGDTLRDYTLAGYRLSPAQTDSTKLTWDTSIKLSEFHANSTCACLLISMGASWCPACMDEQPALADDVATDPSFCVLEILQEGLQMGVVATHADVDAWTQQFMENFYVVQGTALTEHLFDGYGSTIGLPFNLIVKPSSMTVEGVVQGFESDIYTKAMQLCRQ
jgi:hypothetical protein